MQLRNLLFLFAFLLVACNGDNTTGSRVFKDTLPDSNGGRLDLIVVAKESLWQTVAGDELRKTFSSPQPGLPQPEPEFTVRQIEPDKFNTLLQRARNIVVLEKAEFGFTKQEDLWAEPQIVFNLAAEDERALSELVRARSEEMYKAFKELEVDILQKRLSAKVHKNLPLLEQHNVSMAIPTSFEVEVQQENLMVMWNKTLKTDQGIIIYFQPMTNERLGLGTEIIPLRDSLTALHVQSEREGAYMVTEDLIAPTIVNTQIADQFAIETRGLWRTKNDFKGGPFINYTVYDEANNQVIFLDGFIFSPETKKRNFVLELEAILKTLSIKS